MNKYLIQLPEFSGPFDLLLHLIDKEALDVTAISLAQVTEQYLAQVALLKEGKIDRLIDFLVIAARLVLIKSRALLPRPPAVPGGEEEEDPAETLVRQLRQYKRFKQAASWLHGREEAGLRTYLRVAPPPRPKIDSRLDLSGITVTSLIRAMEEVLARNEKLEKSVAVVQPRRLTIEGQLQHVRRSVQAQGRLSFQALLTPRPDRVEIAITLLALLELIKRREVVARQQEPFGPIEVLPVSGAASDAKATTPPPPVESPAHQ